MAPQCCVVVADTVHARIFVAASDGDARMQLVQHAQLANPDYKARGPESPRIKTERNTDRQAGPVHPQFERCTRPRAEIARRFAAEVVECITSTVKSWEKGSVVLAAEPGMLGLLRKAVQDALPRGVVLKALAKDYVELSPSELAQRLDLR